MKKTLLTPDRGLPWEETPFAEETGAGKNDLVSGPEESGGIPYGPCFHIEEICQLLDEMIMDIQHLEVEVVRARYKLSFYLEPPYDEYLRMEIFNSMGGRYQGDPVFDEYLNYRGFKEYEDAIDTPFHVNRLNRLAKGYDDHPDLYP